MRATQASLPMTKQKHIKNLQTPNESQVQYIKHNQDAISSATNNHEQLILLVR